MTSQQKTKKVNNFAHTRNRMNTLASTLCCTQSAQRNNFGWYSVWSNFYERHIIWFVCQKFHPYSNACCVFPFDFATNSATYQYLITFHLRQHKWNNSNSFHNSLQFEAFVCVCAKHTRVSPLLWYSHKSGIAQCGYHNTWTRMPFDFCAIGKNKTCTKVVRILISWSGYTFYYQQCENDWKDNWNVSIEHKVAE